MEKKVRRAIPAMAGFPDAPSAGVSGGAVAAGMGPALLCYFGEFVFWAKEPGEGDR